MTKPVGILILAGLLFALVPSASADTIQYSASGTFSGTTPTSTFTAPNGTWAFSFQADSNPVVSDVISGGGFNLAFSHFSYSLNGSPLAITATDIRFDNASVTGGFSVCFSPFVNGVGCDGIGDSGPQMYTTPESQPTLFPGSFPSTAGQFVVQIGSNFYTQADNTLHAVAVPEPGTLFLFITGLAALGSGFLRKRVSLAT